MNTLYLSLRNQIATQDSRKTIAVVFLGLIITMLVGYAVLINSTVRNAVAYEDMKKDIALMRSEVAELEMAQIRLKQSVTVATARSLGFVDSVHPTFVSVAAPTLSLKR